MVYLHKSANSCSVKELESFFNSVLIESASIATVLPNLGSILLLWHGLLETSGKDYMLTARVYETVKSDIEYTRDKTIQYIRAKEMIIEYIKKHGSANKSTVQELCGFSEQQARRTLEKMQKEYIIKLANGGRYAKYTLI